MVLAVAVGVAVALRAFVIQVFRIPSKSMEPTLQVGDRILVLKLGLLAGSPHAGSIVVFRRPPDDKSSPRVSDLVKRVIGTGGETISSKGDTIYVDGHVLAEPWLPRLVGNCAEQNGFDIGQARGAVQGKVHIPRHDLFVMGDCRGDSEDSRSFGPISESLVVGAVVALVWRHGHPDVHFF